MATRKALTARQREVLDFITLYIGENGYPPTIREIGAQMNIRSTNGVNDHLKALEKKGYIIKDDLKSRALRLTQPEKPRAAPSPKQVVSGSQVEIPLVGRVAAGEPILAVENHSEKFHFDTQLLPDASDLFALRIKGDSMIEVGIRNDDLVFVRRGARASNGQIVIAMIEGEATCKTYYHEGDRVRLQPENAELEPIIVHESDFRESMILGTVVGVFRRYRSA